MDNKKYSVLMSVYYRENAKHLEESLDSIIKQTVTPAELVLVCDGPLTEELDRVIDKYNYVPETQEEKK